MSETNFKGETAKPSNEAVNDAPIETFPRLASGNLERVEHTRWGGHPLVCLVIDGVEWFICQQVGEAFGYPDPTTLQRSINKHWRDRFQSRAAVIEGGLLAKLKDALGVRLGTSLPEGSAQRAPTSSISPYASQIFLLTEDGINRAATLSDAPLAEEFCDWVCGELLPSLRRTGSYSLAGPALEAPASALLVAAQKEQRLAREQRMLWLHKAFEAGALTRQEFAQAVRNLVRTTLTVCQGLPESAPTARPPSRPPQLTLC